MRRSTSTKVETFIENIHLFDMDVSIPTSITDALSAGALAAASGVASAAVTDAYAGLKSLVAGRFGRKAAMAALEEDPRSEPQKGAVAEALAKSGAADDPDVQRLANELARALSELPPADVAAIGLDIEDLQAANVRLRDIVAAGTAVRIRRTSVAGDFEATGIRAGVRETEPKN